VNRKSSVSRAENGFGVRAVLRATFHVQKAEKDEERENVEKAKRKRTTPPGPPP